MANYDEDDMFGGPSDGGGSKFLSPAKMATRRSPSRQSLRPNGTRSSVSLRGASSSLADAMGGGVDGAASGGSGQFSLAHELAAALMPEPSAGSKLLAEEFGIDYDEGAEGIDEEPPIDAAHARDAGAATPPSVSVSMDDVFGGGGPSRVDQENEHELPPTSPSFASELGLDASPDASFGSPSPTQTPSRPRNRRHHHQQPQQDPMSVLTADLASTSAFLSALRILDAGSDAPAGAHHTPALERAAAGMIRHMDEAARDREGQVRSLFEYERELRKIGGEIGGEEVLAQLDELEILEGLDLPSSSSAATAEAARPRSPVVEKLLALQEEASQEWETEPDEHSLDDALDADSDAEPSSPTSPLTTLKEDPVPPAPPVTGPPTARTALPHLVHTRTLTASLVTSLATVSEQAQVNGALTTDAGRKLRALKNRLGEWRAEAEGAERSRARIERWEAGLPADGAGGEAPAPAPMSPGNLNGRIVVRRVDGRKLVEEHLKAFEVALQEAGVKTQAIRAAVAA
ncbi:hypothetical protein PUNSTDRAFT_143136 [Punctularia strigosozonata HHB-11173 SS5]|uniref:uncharacterized protein n=1 Tax=Punctularia strigosozonata (strain HHB-11173) TaxID=741275 RepID=UPI000441772A|nr:uncharacterized protein PUNSTDRAFT_143136 [Punctularia strigosozonata HHB-11173 SS5]EIN09644.1 hypothetical protein PUNSTDRAFT_143136 [Punctularia strigosozonata HHB-11173 SS5]